MLPARPRTQHKPSESHGYPSVIKATQHAARLGGAAQVSIMAPALRAMLRKRREKHLRSSAGLLKMLCFALARFRRRSRVR